MDGSLSARAGQPVSVVVASVSSLDLLGACLTSLRMQCARVGAELIVSRKTADPPEEVARIASGCRLVTAPPGADLPRVRGIGLAAANGDWVILTEDHCIAGAGWVDALIAAAQSSAPVDVLGGSMGNAKRERVTDCGAFFAEYGIYGGAGVRRDGTRGPLFAAANVAYRRSVVTRVAAWCNAGDWENTIHDRLFGEGCKLLMVPAARVQVNRSHRFGEFFRGRIEHGRSYASVRARALSGWRRAALLAGTPLLPPLLASRILGAVHRDEREDYWRALPVTLAFLSAWALGEARGYAHRDVAT